jgi:hypothetical protein
MMRDSAFDQTNYDPTLVNWAAQDPNILNNVAAHFGTAKYSEVAAKDVLVTGHIWTIIDGGQA